MKKIILLAIATLMVVGCNYENGSVYVTTTLDSCEYLISGSLINHSTLTHKGNCRFCTERRKQELKELVEQLKGK